MPDPTLSEQATFAASGFAAIDPVPPRRMNPAGAAPIPPQRPQALVDVLDHLLDTGVVLDGQLVLSVAGIDLVQIGLRALLASVDSASRVLVPGRLA
jgi:hypothetical protein